MEVKSEERREPRRIGELLIEAGIIRSEELPKSLKEAQDRSLRLGEVLVMLRYVTSEDLEAVLQAQSRLNEGTISDTQALAALRMASSHRLPFDEALDRTKAMTGTRAQKNEEQQLKQLLKDIEAAEIKHGTQNREIGNIAVQVGDWYLQHKKFDEAEQYYRRALLIFERSFGQRNLKVATCLGRLGDLYFAQKKNGEAESLYWRVLDITQSAWGTDHMDVAQCQKSLARVLEAEGRLKEAEQFYLSSLRIMERVGGEDAPELNETLRMLAAFWMRQGKRPERKRLGDLLVEAGVLKPEELQEALQKSAQARAPLGQTLVKLNMLSESQLRPALQAQLLIGDGVLPATFATRALRQARENNSTLDEALRELGWEPDKFSNEELQMLITTAEELMSAEVTLGFEHAGVAILTAKLADKYVEQKKYAEAEPLYKRALTILEKFFGPKDPEVATALVKMARLNTLENNEIDAERNLWRALEIRQLAYGQDNIEVADCLDRLAELYEKQGNVEQSHRLYQSAITIKEKMLGREHARTLSAWEKSAFLSFCLHNYLDAENIYLRLIRTKQKLGTYTPIEIADLLQKLADVYFTQGELTKALTQQELAIDLHDQNGEKSERTAELMEKYSILLDKAGRTKESREYLERAKSMKRIRE